MYIKAVHSSARAPRQAVGRSAEHWPTLVSVFLRVSCFSHVTSNLAKWLLWCFLDVFNLVVSSLVPLLDY